MAESREDIAELVRTLVLPLVEDQEAVSFETSETEDGALLIDMRVAPEDAGKVIGRSGRVIKAIRTLARAAASRNGIDAVEVELIDE